MDEATVAPAFDYGHWDISEVGEFTPTEWFGFIYRIDHKSSGKAYIGKKFFKFKRKKTKTNKSRTKESDWQYYTSSSDVVNDLIAECGKDDFEFRILRLCSGRCELTYSEEEAQFGADVLRARLPNGERKYLNKTIGYKIFSGVEKQSDETRRKMSLHSRWKGGAPKPERREDGTRVFTDEHRAKLSEARKGKSPWNKDKKTGVGGPKGQPMTDEHKQKISDTLKAKGIEPVTCRMPKSAEHRAKIAEALRTVYIDELA